MSILNWLRNKNKQKQQQNNKLEAGMGGGVVTPIVGAFAKTPKNRLLNRLNIINKQIEKLQNDSHKNVSSKLQHWEKRKDKVKALLWIYYDENIDND